MAQEPLYQQGEPRGGNTLLRVWATDGDFQVRTEPATQLPGSGQPLHWEKLQTHRFGGLYPVGLRAAWCHVLP